MQKIYYKVLNLNKSSYAAYGRYSVNYKFNEFVRPLRKNTPLFVFDSLDSAKNFVGDGEHIKIFKCSVIRPRKIRYKISSSIFDINCFWNNRRKEQWYSILFRRGITDYQPTTKKASKGTIIVDAVKILKEVPFLST